MDCLYMRRGETKRRCDAAQDTMPPCLARASGSAEEERLRVRRVRDELNLKGNLDEGSAARVYPRAVPPFHYVYPVTSPVGPSAYTAQGPSFLLVNTYELLAPRILGKSCERQESRGGA